MALIFCSWLWHEVAGAQPLCVKSRTAALRKSPSVKSRVSWVVGRYMPVFQVGRKGQWRQVSDLNGVKHWVQARHVTSRYTCAVVKAKSARLWQEASEKSRPADLLFAERYSPFKKLDRDGAWVRVEDDHQGVFWIHENQLWIPANRTRIAF